MIVVLALYTCCKVRPSTSSITTMWRLKSIGLGTGNPRSYKAFIYANSLVADILDK